MSEEGEDSPLEQCGFVVSFFIFPLSGILLLWLIGSDIEDDSENSSDMPALQQLLETTNKISTSLVCLFVAAPLLYGMVNRLSSPRLDSIHNLVDEHTRIPSVSVNSRKSVQKKEKEHVPEICDCPIGVVNQILDRRLG